MFRIGDKVADSVGLRKGEIIFISPLNYIYVQWENESISIMAADEIYPIDAIPKDENSEL